MIQLPVQPEVAAVACDDFGDVYLQWTDQWQENRYQDREACKRQKIEKESEPQFPTQPSTVSEPHSLSPKHDLNTTIIADSNKHWTEYTASASSIDGQTERSSIGNATSLHRIGDGPETHTKTLDESNHLYEALSLDELSKLTTEANQRQGSCIWNPRIHDRFPQVARKVDLFFLDHWGFLSLRQRSKFLAMGFSKVTCLYFPLALDGRIESACKLLTVLFLIDDLLDKMSLSDGQAMNERLISIIKDELVPDEKVPSEYILHGIFEEMRSVDSGLAADVVQGTVVFMKAQTDRSRLTIDDLGQYLRYREGDVGRALLCALMRYTQSLHLSPPALKLMRRLEIQYSQHVSVVNDIMSWEKESRDAVQARDGADGSALCSAVNVLRSATSLSSVNACKRVLWALVREWEHEFDREAARLECEIKAATDAEETAVARPTSSISADEAQTMMIYIEGLRLQMSGNELWSLTTPRYS